MQAEMADEIAALDDEILDEAEGEQAITETMASGASGHRKEDTGR